MLTRMQRKRISFALLVGKQTGVATMENSMEVPQKVKNRWECKLVQPLWKTVWRFLKKLKIEIGRAHV